MDCRIQCPISTEHLHLRSFAISDAESRWRLYTDPEIVRYTGSTITREQSDGFLARGIDAFARGEECVLAVCLKGSGDLVGFCGLQPLGAEPELLVGIRSDQRKRGFAKEASEAVVAAAWAGKNFDRIVARVSPENGPSSGLALAIGMVLTGKVQNGSDDLYALARPARAA